MRVQTAVQENLAEFFTEFFSFVGLLELAPVIAVLTSVIALLGVWIAWQQLKTNKANLRERLFERRMEVFKGTQNFLSEIAREIEISRNSLDQFTVIYQKSRFLFGSQMQDYLGEIRRRALEMQRCGKETKDGADGQNRLDLIAKKHKEAQWLVDQLDIIFDKFEPWLGFENHT